MSGTSEDDKPERRVGTLLAGRYHLLSVLGEGGMGWVYRATDTTNQQPVAVKLLKAEVLNDREVVARFEREAHAMIALQHPNLVQALDYGKTDDGDLCLVMELVEGETLRSLYKRYKPLSPWLALELARQLGAALVQAHEHGIVHRDLKPENLMVRFNAQNQPHLKVLDFGMARLLLGQTGTPLTRKGAVFGTPEYMPPEQAMGQPVDARADQYALGVILYEMLAGTRPFKASSPLEMLQLQIRQAPPSLLDVDPRTPPTVAAIVLKMMAKKPDERFATVRDAVDGLLSAAWPSLRASFPQLPPTPSRVG